jgi:hypothetical protein
MSVIGTNRTSGDVRYLVANGGKRTSRGAVSAENDPYRNKRKADCEVRKEATDHCWDCVSRS